MGRSNQLRSSDVRQLLQVVAELGDLPRRKNDRLAHLLQRMRTVFRARVASAAAAELKPDQTLRCFNAVSSGIEESDFRKYTKLLYDARGNRMPMAPYFAQQIAEQIKPRSVFDRRVLFDDRAWYRSTHTMEFCRLLGIDENLYALALVPGTPMATGFSLSRPWGDRRPFTSRERQMFELLMRATVSLIVPADQPDLPRRQQQVLDLLIKGLAVKQIASDLQISVHTVNEHMGVLYRRFNVNSRSELAARFVR